MAEGIRAAGRGGIEGRKSRPPGPAALRALIDDLGLPELMAAVQPQALDGGIDIPSLLASERAMASVCESVIGACYLHHGFQPTADATVQAFADQIELSQETMLDFKSALQEQLAREGSR